VINTTPLSEREFEVFRLYAEGLTPEQIGAKLYLLPATVRTYMAHIRAKLDATTNAHAVLVALRGYPHLLKGTIAKHGTAQSVNAHTANGTPLCPACQEFLEPKDRATRVMSTFRRLTPPEQRLKKGAPVECGTIQAARRHIREGDRIGDLVCGCREAYQQWWRDYRQNAEAS
jgi:DNA-binding CsgD family transcriptional regulator